MKIPKKFKVNGKTWTVGYKWNLRDPDNDEKLDGINLPKTREVFIDRSCSKEEREQAFIHELLHSVFAENHIREVVSIESEEIIVSMLEEYLWCHFDLRWRKSPKE